MQTAAEPEVALPDVPLLETDGEPLETSWHRAEINLLIEVLAWLFRDRDDYYSGGNMFIYYSEEQARTRRYRGPDFFYVEGVSRTPDRPYWVVWREGGRYPDVIIELLSPTTAVEDCTTKKDLYERVFRTHEYFCYDPDRGNLEGWRLGKRRRYQAIKPDERGWMWVETLQLWLGPWNGTYLGTEAIWPRFYDAEGKLVPTRAEAEEQRANEQQRRAEAAEAEVAQLKARLAELEKKPKTNRKSG
jgi:Uma2 family endonuclease